MRPCISIPELPYPQQAVLTTFVLFSPLLFAPLLPFLPYFPLPTSCRTHSADSPKCPSGEPDCNGNVAVARGPSSAPPCRAAAAGVNGFPAPPGYDSPPPRYDVPPAPGASGLVPGPAAVPPPRPPKPAPPAAPDSEPGYCVPPSGPPPSRAATAASTGDLHKPRRGQRATPRPGREGLCGHAC